MSPALREVLLDLTAGLLRTMSALVVICVIAVLLALAFIHGEDSRCKRLQSNPESTAYQLERYCPPPSAK